MFGILNFGHCDLPFDWAQGGEVVSMSNHLVFEISLLPKSEHRYLAPSISENMLSDKAHIGLQLGHYVDFITATNFTLFQNTCKDPLARHDAVSGLVIYGAFIVALFTDLGDFD